MKELTSPSTVLLGIWADIKGLVNLNVLMQVSLNNLCLV
jgi:hypothetical protein